jgi:hypothetical protein
MIAFNFNIKFDAESTLDDGKYNRRLETICVTPMSEGVAQTSWDVNSDWLDMSGRKARYLAQNEFSLSTETGSRWALEIKDVLTLQWSIGNPVIQYRAGPQYTPQRLQFWVCHTLLPLKFSLEKRYEMLHVGAVEVDGRPICFSAESFGGKSVLTDYFIKQGHGLYADDSLAVYPHDGTFNTVASYPFHRPYREPEVLGEAADNVPQGAAPVHAIYVLEKAPANAPITLTELKGVDKYKAFHFSGFIDLSFFKAHHFKMRSTLAELIPAYTATIPWNLDRLPAVYSAIIEHCGIEDSASYEYHSC